MKKLLIVAALLASSTAAMAEGGYAGATIGRAHSDLDCSGTTSCSNNGTAGKIFGGYSFNETFSVEGTYYDLGKVSATFPGGSGDISTTGFGVRGVAAFPITKELSGFAALGINRMKAKVNGTIGNASGSADSNSTKPSVAFGLDYAITPMMKIRGEVESLRADVTGGGGYTVRTVALGLKFDF